MPPKIKFSVGKLDEYFYMINKFLNPKKEEWDWSEYIFKEYPQLKKEFGTRRCKRWRKETAYNFFKKQLKQKKPQLQKKAKQFQASWDRINNVEQEWPKQDKKIQARITLNPICPRNIKDRTFDLYYMMGLKRMKNTAIHETLHYIYFEKWKRVFPKTKTREFDAPYLVWHLSEMVPQVILMDKRIQKVHKHDARAYDTYQNCLIQGKPLMAHLQKLYNQRKDFEDFLKKSWAFEKKHDKKIKAL